MLSAAGDCWDEGEGLILLFLGFYGVDAGDFGGVDGGAVAPAEESDFLLLVLLVDEVYGF